MRKATVVVGGIDGFDLEIVELRKTPVKVGEVR